MRNHPMVELLRGVILDDMQTSNNHIYVSAGPFQGSVFFLSHDGDSRIVYASLPEFLAAAIDARTQEEILEDLHPARSPLALDQPRLSAWILHLLTLEHADGLVPPLVPSLDRADTPLLRRLATDTHFFVAESVALEICARPNKALAEVAVLCAQHQHRQASRAGHVALSRIQALET